MCNMCMYVPVFVEAKSHPRMSFLRSHPPYVLRWGLSLAPGIHWLGWPCWPSNSRPGIFICTPLVLLLKVCVTKSSFLCGFWGSNLGLLWADLISPAPPAKVQKDKGLWMKGEWQTGEAEVRKEQAVAWILGGVWAMLSWEWLLKKHLPPTLDFSRLNTNKVSVCPWRQPVIAMYLGSSVGVREGIDIPWMLEGGSWVCNSFCGLS